MIQKNIKQLKKALEIKDEILGIYFSNKLPQNFKYHQDTACTALARAFSKKKTVIFDAKKYPQLCSGANYFLKLSKIRREEAVDIYVKKEHIFKNKKFCKKFLRQLPKFPKFLKNKFIIIKPLKKKDKPQVIIFLINPAQAGRIIGLLNYGQYKKIEIYPNQPTCLSLFAPFVTKKPHINFLDYYDRYYQGRIKGKNIWSEDKLIISLTYSQFKKILSNLKKSPHGVFRPKISPRRVDDFSFSV